MVGPVVEEFLEAGLALDIFSPTLQTQEAEERMLCPDSKEASG